MHSSWQLTNEPHCQLKQLFAAGETIVNPPAEQGRALRQWLYLAPGEGEAAARVGERVVDAILREIQPQHQQSD